MSQAKNYRVIICKVCWIDHDAENRVEKKAETHRVSIVKRMINQIRK